MNEVMRFLNSHGSVRHFTERPVTEADETNIITTAQRSPTTSNIQAYSIVSVRDAGHKELIAGWAGNQDHIIKAPLFLVFCADLFRLRTLNEARDYPYDAGFTELFIQATVDTALVAGRALQAAQAIGMGGVMVGGIRNKIQELSDLLELPELVYPVMGMSIGYPAIEAKIKPRLPQEAVAFKERYDTGAFKEPIREYDDTILHLGYLKGREARPEDYPDFEGVYSWSEHTARRMANLEGTVMRRHMLDYLQARGFLLK